MSNDFFLDDDDPEYTARVVALAEAENRCMDVATAYVRRYRSRRTKPRRTKEQVLGIRYFARNALAEDKPMTCRQVFYRLVSQGAIFKTEGEYKQTVLRLLKDMRKRREIPFSWIADNTRWMRKPTTFSSYQEMLRCTAKTYRRSVWDTQDAYCEIWLEKDALSGVLYEETSAWDVPLMVTRGYPSISFLASAAEEIQSQTEQGKTTFLYYFGDRDPSGVDIPRHVEESLREFAPDAPIHFECVAVTQAQIEEFDLPTRPTKTTDSRSKSFVGESVEVDAIMPSELRRIARECITQHIDQRAYELLLTAEESERRALLRIVKQAA